MARSDATQRYPLAGAEQVQAHPNFPTLEEQVLEYWRADGTFRASVEARDAGDHGSNEFVFYDGPPFANGLPHYGHLLTGYVKDVVPRYRTMRGSRVERRFGWDTHGLPAELEAMSQLGLKTKDDILALGIEAFNDACRESVLKYTGEWENYVTRQARWVDFEGDYKTLEPWYMESVLWAFKTLWDKGLVYEGLRVLPYCWNDETPLSNHELRMDDDVYQQRQDPAVTVGLRLETGELALIWTTTPWTLPSNLAVAVGPDIDYVVLRPGEGGTAPDESYVVAAARVAAYAREFGSEPVVLSQLKGSDLVGRTYTPIFSYFADHEGAFRVLPADYVTTEDGTGLVHIAPAFGEEDKAVTDAAGIAPVVPVGASGRFEWPVTDYAGMQVFDANAVIIDDLKKATRGESAASVSPGTVLLRHETYDHSYPHCWRCRKPLIYKAVSSWFVEVTKFRDRMVELNKDITWVPEHIKDGQFGKWLSNARDWSISRNRFWGSPIPVWKSDDPAYPRIDVYGSIAELEADFGVPVPDLHRPFIDELTRPNPDDPTGKSTMRRIEDVLDVWFDSGSMPFAQVGYPQTNSDWFENHFPGDFIVEYIGQTRGWFYTMHVLSTALFDRPAFNTCLSHGIVLGSDGQKMSKSLRNYPDVSEVFDRDGSDAMRWFLMSSPILRGGNLVVTEQGIRESVRQAVLPLWNAWYFHALYAGAAGPGGTTGKIGEVRTDSTDVLDRYLLAKTADLVGELTEQLDVYDIAGACASVRSYLELLTNWYIRRSRDRFWVGDDDAIDTLHTVLETVTRALAPLLPLTTEQIWRGLTGGRSVHLADYPAASSLPSDPSLVSAMDEIREVASVALSLRKEAKIRVRQPLSTLTVTTPAGSRLEFLSALLADEVNVRSVVFHELSESGPSPVQRQLTVNARAAGPRLGKQVQAALKAAKAGDWTEVDGVVTAGGIELAEGEYTVELVVDSSAGGAVAVLKSGGFVALDTELTDDLRADGDVADLIRLVQQARKDADLHVSDRIRLGLGVSEAVWAAVRARAELVQAETLAVELERIDQLGAPVGSIGESGEQLWVQVSKTA